MYIFTVLKSVVFLAFCPHLKEKKSFESSASPLPHPFGVAVMCVFFLSLFTTNSARVSEVVSLCERSHFISCSIEWGKTHKHNLTEGGGVFVYLADPVCGSVGENLLQIPNIVPCTWNTKIHPVVLTRLFFRPLQLMHH